jgi:hypothetical protein
VVLLNIIRGRARRAPIIVAVLVVVVGLSVGVDLSSVGQHLRRAEPGEMPAK